MVHKSYVMVDNRAAGGSFTEYDVVGCRHCQNQLKVYRNARSGAYCMRCMGPVCETEACATRCTPFFSRIERFNKLTAKGRWAPNVMVGVGVKTGG